MGVGVVKLAEVRAVMIWGGNGVSAKVENCGPVGGVVAAGVAGTTVAAAGV